MSLDKYPNSFGIVSSNNNMSADTNMLNNKILKNLDVSQNGIIWNCRGVKMASCEIKKLCNRCHPGFLFISETKTNDYGILTLARKFGFHNFDSCLANGSTGGIALFWQDHYKFDSLVKDKSLFHCVVSNNSNFDICVSNKSNFDIWFVTFVQGTTYGHEKNSFWSKIENIGSTIEGAWMLVRDFNEVLSKNEKWGGGKFKRKQGEILGKIHR